MPVAQSVAEFIRVRPMKDLEPGLFGDMRLAIEGCVLGSLPNKSNSRQIVMPRGSTRPLVIKSPEARAWEKRFNALALGSRPKTPLAGPFKLLAVVYYPDRRRDLDCELLCDALQRSGLIENDRAIERKEYERRIDHDFPRVEFEVTPWPTTPAV